jgi:hypothetical protein
MIQSLRRQFNRRYTDEQYRDLLRAMDDRTRTHLTIRVAETPVFLPAGLVQHMADEGAAMTMQLVGDQEYLRAAAATIPAAFRVANQDAHPNFMTVDFGLVYTGEGAWNGDVGLLEPRLVELQAFPSVYGYQSALGDCYREAFELPDGLESYLGNMDEQVFWDLMRQAIVADHDPAHVVLMEVTPQQQKTLPDFHVHEDRVGIRTVDIADIYQRGRKLYYLHGGVEMPIRRIYNRAIADEMVRKGITPGFDLTADLDVEWAGHPNWYFLLSKFSLPYLRRPTVPPAVFLDAWMRGEDRDLLPQDRSQWVLKPLFSFAGKGIQFAPSDDTLQAIPVDERGGYLLQQRMHFQPVIETPFGMTQAEIRILYVWPAGGQLQPAGTLVRLGRGAMMGVDHNKDQQWVGGSAGFVSTSAG